ncbi:hypothetical protein OBBRIDRAFT_34828 [Obba rivulosa]|uniref:Uncharacterized protein n=1 Tax=Obba rivulosa TaxID=1052685 RepID=A0A8E2DIF0_9APHY|nr:hypothetical protein OBBRIDRAFT_34828 [Obba rivulosa]
MVPVLLEDPGRRRVELWLRWESRIRMRDGKYTGRSKWRHGGSEVTSSGVAPCLARASDPNNRRAYFNRLRGVLTFWRVRCWFFASEGVNTRAPGLDRVLYLTTDVQTMNLQLKDEEHSNERTASSRQAYIMLRRRTPIMTTRSWPNTTLTLLRTCCISP